MKRRGLNPQGAVSANEGHHDERARVLVALALGINVVTVLQTFVDDLALE
jgi:hypothetical protein